MLLLRQVQLRLLLGVGRLCLHLELEPLEARRAALRHVVTTQPKQPPAPAGAALLLDTGLLATVAQLLMTRAYAIGRPLVNASLQYMGIVFSFGYGVWLFKDPITGLALAGMVTIILAGVAATALRNESAPQAGSPTAES